LGTACYLVVQYHSVFPHKKKAVKAKICEARILRIVLYGYETWSLTLWEEYCSKVFKNRVLSGILALIREDIKWGWRLLHVEEIYDFYIH